MYSCERPIYRHGEQFRTDAKCAPGFVVLAGHHLATGEWFSMRLTASEAPFLFKPDGESSWASAPAELLATLVAVIKFGYCQESKRSHFAIYLAAGTDNKSNEALLRKGASTRWPLTLINLQMTEILMKAGIRLELRWRPGMKTTLQIG